MKTVLSLIAAGVIMLSGISHANIMTAETPDRSMTVRVSVHESQFRVGENRISIEVFDIGGEYVTDAEVSVYYFMPSMPSMNYEAGASPEEKRYSAVIKPTMPGVWEADIKVRKNGGEQKARISFEIQ